jgi:predicted MFS family arabinose efflux permease
MDRRIVMMLAAFGATLASFALAVAPVFGENALAVTFAAAMLFGAASFPIGSLANAHLNDRSHAGDVSETATAILLISGSAAGLGTLLGAQAMTYAGPAGLFYYCAIVHIALLAFIVTRMAQRPPA